MLFEKARICISLNVYSKMVTLVFLLTLPSTTSNHAYQPYRDDFLVRLSRFVLLTDYIPSFTLMIILGAGELSTNYVVSEMYLIFTFVPSSSLFHTSSLSLLFLSSPCFSPLPPLSNISSLSYTFDFPPLSSCFLPLLYLLH